MYGLQINVSKSMTQGSGVSNMQEAEVSLWVALYYIRNQLTAQDIKVSIDGAHIRTGNIVHFDIWNFTKEHGMSKMDGIMERWQGEYAVEGSSNRIIISSVPGIGDVNILRKDGKELYIESKKGKNDKKGQEYSLMREAIGQLMTGCEMTENIIPVVAVPFSDKSHGLALRWSQYEQMKHVGIKFFLVKSDGELEVI